MNEGRTQRDLRAAMSLPSSTSSRNVAALAVIDRLGKPGLSLITWEDSLEDRRAKLLRLTPKGRSLVNRLLSDL